MQNLIRDYLINPRLHSIVIALLFAFGFLLGTTTLHSQDLDDGETVFDMSFEELMKLDVVGVSKFLQPFNKAPAPVMIITQQQINERGYFDLSDLLVDLPGIDIVDNARGYGEFYTIRGIEGNDRFLVLIDGQKINPVSGTFISVGNSISVRFADRVEIIMGPASAIYGADAFAGIINIVSKGFGTEPRISTYVRSGSRALLDLGVDYYATLGKNIQMHFTGRSFRSAGPDFSDRDTIYATIDHYAYPLLNVFEQPVNDHNVRIKLSYKDFFITYYRQQFDEGNALGLPPNSYIYNAENRWKMSTDIVWANYRTNLKNGSIIDANLAYVSHMQDPSTQFLKSKAPHQYDETFSQYLTGSDKTVRGEISFHQQFVNRISLVSGVEFESTNSIPPYANDQIFGESLESVGAVARKLETEILINERRFAIYNQLSYAPSKNLDLILGGRYDLSARYGPVFNPRIGIILRPFDGTVAKLIYGTAFQAPSLFFEYEQWGAATAVMLSVDEIRNTDPNWELKNQRINTYDLTLNQKVTDAVYAQFNAYRHSLTDIIERTIYTNAAYNKYFSGDDSTVYSLGFRNENLGVQTTNGMIMEVRAEMGSRLSGYFHYAFTDAVIEQSDGKSGVPRVATNKAGLGLTLRNLFGLVTFSTRLKIIGDINNRNATLFPDGKQPGYTIVDLDLTFNNLFPHSQLQINVNNVFDSDIQHAGLLDQLFYLPVIHQPGRELMIGLTVTL